jgi:hypothetical protein
MADKIKTDAEISKEIFEEYSTGERSTWATAVVKDRAFYNGVQIETDVRDDLEAVGKSTLVINETTPSIRQVIGSLVENDPRFTATARENSDVRVAGDVADLLSYIWYNSDGNAKLEKSATDYEVDGVGILMAYLDPYADWGKGEIKICDLNPLDVYADPLCKEPTLKDSPHILISYINSKSRIQNVYPDFDFKDAVKEAGDNYPTTTLYETEDQILDADNLEEEKYRLIDRYSKIKVPRYHVYDPNSQFEAVFDEQEYLDFGKEPAVIVTKVGGKDQYITRKSDVVEMMSLAQQTGGVYHLIINPVTGQQEIKSGVEIGEFNEIPNSTTRLEIVTMTDLLNEGAILYDVPKIDRIKRVFTIGEKEVYNAVLPISDYPIKAFMLYHNRNPFPHGDVRLIKPLQEQLNKITELIITYNTNIANIKSFTPKGSGLKKKLDETGGRPGAENYEYDPDLGGVPIFVQFTQMATSFYQQKVEIIQQMQRIVGAYSFQDGNVSNAPDTKGGTLMLDEFGQRRTNMKRKSIERAITQLAKVIVEMIPYAYTDRKVIRVTKPNNTTKQIVFNDPIETEKGKIEIVNDLTVGKYDVVMVSGSMLPVNRWARFEKLESLYVNGVIQDPSTVLENLDMPNLEEILAREDKIRQLQGQMEQAMQEIKKLRGDLQSRDRETVEARKKVEVIKTASKLKDIASKAEAQAMIEKNKKEKQAV